MGVFNDNTTFLLHDIHNTLNVGLPYMWTIRILLVMSEHLLFIPMWLDNWKLTYNKAQVVPSPLEGLG